MCGKIPSSFLQHAIKRRHVPAIDARYRIIPKGHDTTECDDVDIPRLSSIIGFSRTRYMPNQKYVLFHNENNLDSKRNNFLHKSIRFFSGPGERKSKGGQVPPDKHALCYTNDECPAHVLFPSFHHLMGKHMQS